MLRFGYEASAEHLGPNDLLGFSVLAEKLGFASAETIARFHGADAADIGRLRRPAVAFADDPPRSRRGTR